VYKTSVLLNLVCMALICIHDVLEFNYGVLLVFTLMYSFSGIGNIWTMNLYKLIALPLNTLHEHICLYLCERNTVTLTEEKSSAALLGTLLQMCSCSSDITKPGTALVAEDSDMVKEKGKILILLLHLTSQHVIY